MLPYEHLRFIVDDRLAALRAERAHDAMSAGLSRRQAAAGWRSVGARLGLALIRTGAWLRGETWRAVEADAGDELAAGLVGRVRAVHEPRYACRRL